MFHYIEAINFFSWGQLNFEFKSGVTLISGENLDDGNSEGCGKSSIPNALCWGLYGQLPKDVNIDDVIKTGEKGCFVTIVLKNGWIIQRSRKPNDLCIIESGGGWAERAEIRGKDVKETQKMINDLIDMSFDTFCQSVYFAQNYNNKFITANQEEKAKILSELQDLSIFDRASKKANDLLKQAKVDLSILDTDQKSKQYLKKVHTDSFNTFCQLSDDFGADKLKQLDDIIDRSSILSKKILQIQSEIKEITGLESIPQKVKELEEVEKYLDECNRKLYLIEQLEAQKQQAITNKSCPTCGQDLKNSGCEDIKIPDNTDLLQQKFTLEKQFADINNERISLMEKQNHNDKLKERLTGTIEQRNQLGKEVSRIESMNNPYLDKISEYHGKMESLEANISVNQEKIQQKTKEIQYLEFLKPGFKEIKSHVFQGLLTELNNKANRYLKDLFDITAIIKFDNVSDEGEVSKIQTKVILGGSERSLGMLSGGQFRRVQLAVDFALSDIVANRSDKPINIRILDESLKDLSEPSCAKVIEILQKMGGSTILIEHNSIVKNIVNQTFEIQLKDGISSDISK